MRKHLYSTVSYPVMTLVINLHQQAKARKTDEYLKFVLQQQKLRYEAIINGRPYKEAFS